MRRDTGNGGQAGEFTVGGAIHLANGQVGNSHLEPATTTKVKKKVEDNALLKKSVDLKDVFVGVMIILNSSYEALFSI